MCDYKELFESGKNLYELRKNFDPGAFKSEVEQLPFTTVYAMETPEDKLDMFNNLFLSCLERHCPLIRQKLTRPPAPWLKDIAIETKLRQRDHLRKTSHSIITESVWNDFRKIRNEIKKAIRAAKSIFYKRALSSKRPKEVWNTIHRILHPNPQTIKANPETLNKHFNTTAQRLLNSAPKTGSMLNELIESLPLNQNAYSISKVFYACIRKAILGLRNDCSTGSDKIQTKYLKL